MFPAVAEIAGNKKHRRGSYLQMIMTALRIIKAGKRVARHCFWPGRSRESRRAVLRIRNLNFGVTAAQGSIESAMVLNDPLSKCDVVATKIRHIAVRFVEVDPVHCQIHQMSRHAHYSDGGSRKWPILFLVKSRRLCKASLRGATLFHPTRWHRLRY
jgi:hypothetical protein